MKCQAVRSRLFAVMGAYDMHNAASSKERTRRTQWVCLKPSESFRLSVHLSDSHASSVCVCAFLLYEDKEASCSTTLAELGCEAA